MTGTQASLHTMMITLQNLLKYGYKMQKKHRPQVSNNNRWSLNGDTNNFWVLILILKATKETSNPKGILPVNPDRNEIPVNTEPIEIIENSVAHQTVRFKLNDPPKGRDAWVGIYLLMLAIKTTVIVGNG